MQLAVDEILSEIACIHDPTHSLGKKCLLLGTVLVDAEWSFCQIIFVCVAIWRKTTVTCGYRTDSIYAIKHSPNNFFSILTVNLAIFQVDPKPAAPINKVRWYEFNYCVKCLYHKTTLQKLFDVFVMNVCICVYYVSIPTHNSTPRLLFFDVQGSLISLD